MYRIETRIKNAFDRYQENGNLKELAVEVADVADYSVHSRGNAVIMYDAISTYCPLTAFECVFYDGETGVYHLLDFDPNGLDREALLTQIYAHLRLECFIDQVDRKKAMENVYLLNVNTLVKVRELE